MFYEIDIERHRVRLMAYENRNAAYDLSLFDDSSDYVPGSAAPERKEEVHLPNVIQKTMLSFKIFSGN